MIQHTLALTLLVAAAPRALAQEPGFFDESALRTLRLEFANGNWHNQLVANFDKDLYVKADLYIDSLVYREVGVQHRGDVSYTYGQTLKEPLKVTLDAFVPDQTHAGLDVITLDNGRMSSVFQEVVALWIVGPHLFTPRANLVHVVAGTAANPNDLGVYTNIERLDKAFFRRHFRDDEGTRYTAADASVLPHPFEDHGPDPLDYKPYYVPQGGEKPYWVRMRDASLAMSHAPLTQLRQQFDPLGSSDLCIRMWVTNAAITNVDSFWYGKNYKLYQDVFHDDQLVPLPWDLDLCLLGASQDHLLRHYANSPVSRFFLTEEGIERAWAVYAAMLEREFFIPFFGARLTALRELAEPFILGSPNEFITTSAELDAIVKSIRNSVKVQRSYLLGLPELQRERPAIAIHHEPPLPVAGDVVHVVAEIGLASTTVREVLLWSRVRGNFTARPMLDDGASGDGAAGDGVYGAALAPASAGDLVQYYVEVRPDDLTAAMYGFEPRATEYRPAAFEVAFTPGAGGPRFTELLYSGDDGELIEVTNTGAAPVDLTGYSLDDKSATTGTFDLSPAGVLAPGASFLVTDQSPASFRSAWGLPAGTVVLGPNDVANVGRNDVVHLFAPDGSLVDRLSYGDEDFPGSHRPKDDALTACAAAVGADFVYGWSAAAVPDDAGSWESSGGDVGSPGVHVATGCGIERVCAPAVPNSTGFPARAGAYGERTVTAPLVLTADRLPEGKLGMLLVSKTQGFVQAPGGSQGNLCLAGAIGRFSSSVVWSDLAGRVELSVDPTSIPQPDTKVAVQPGETWTFQWWYRDQNPTPTSNFSDAVAIVFE